MADIKKNGTLVTLAKKNGTNFCWTAREAIGSHTEQVFDHYENVFDHYDYVPTGTYHNEVQSVPGPTDTYGINQPIFKYVFSGPHFFVTNVLVDCWVACYGQDTNGNWDRTDAHFNDPSSWIHIAPGFNNMLWVAGDRDMLALRVGVRVSNPDGSISEFSMISGTATPAYRNIGKGGDWNGNYVGFTTVSPYTARVAVADTTPVARYRQEPVYRTETVIDYGDVRHANFNKT